MAVQYQSSIRNYKSKHQLYITNINDQLSTTMIINYYYSTLYFRRTDRHNDIGLGRIY